MTRIVRQINIAPNRQVDATVRLFSEFSSQPNLVLLGDPGAGKTHLFKEAASAEGARYLKARAFLATPAQMLSGQALFIDGLDEKRAGRGDQDTVDAMVEKLFVVSPAKVRISCRAADWLGESDLAALRPYFEQSGEAPVLLLQNLSRKEQRAVLQEQGINLAAADEFLATAEERGLSDFLENPQNLIMLWRAVETGSWPSTRKELFELSTNLMLEEFNPDRARRGSGTYSVAELRPVAGAICAARLISDVEAISLTDQEGTLDTPGYRSVRLFPPELVQAALGRRVFDAGAEPETVDYAHRTTAEFLAAEFLAARIRSGLPFGRLMALVGIDGYPARELRGLHAWLAVHLPEYADQLIEADPYGILTYGDVASLSPSSGAHLVRELDRLSKSNPWFRSGNWRSLPIGALARPDMVAEFRAVLNNPRSGFGIRSLVVEALALGTPIPEMLPDLEEILTRQDAPFAERAGALNALLRLGEAGKAGIRDAYSALGKALNALRLRSEIVGELYGEPFGSADVIALLHDSLEAEDRARTATLGILADQIPLSDLPDILDGVNPPKELDEIDPTNALYRTKSVRLELRRREVGSFYERVLARVWRSYSPLDLGRGFSWLRKRLDFEGGYGGLDATDLRAALRETPDRLSAIADHFLRSVRIDGAEWLAWHRFREAILFELSSEALLEHVVKHLHSSKDDDRQQFLYEVGYSLCYQPEQPHGREVFTWLYALADSRSNLRDARERAVVAKLPANYFRGRSSRHIVAEDSREQQRSAFDADAPKILNGVHLGWMQHIARIYFAFYNDVNTSQTYLKFSDHSCGASR